MAVFPVDGSRLRLRATGVVSESADMVQGGDGKWSNVGQARDKGTGFPLWDVEVVYRAESYGRSSTVVSVVSVGAVDEPVVVEDSYVQFTNLVVSCSTSKRNAGVLGTRFSAESIVEPPRGARVVKSEPAG